MVMIIRPQPLEVVDTVEKDGVHVVPNTDVDKQSIKPKWIKDLILSGTILTTSFLVTLAGMHWHLTLLDVFCISNAFTISISLAYKKWF